MSCFARLFAVIFRIRDKLHCETGFELTFYGIHVQSEVTKNYKEIFLDDHIGVIDSRTLETFSIEFDFLGF